MLAEAVALHDVRDAEAFVQATLNASRRIYPPDEREELVAEGLRIMVELSASFVPQRDGYAHAGRFSGYAAKFLRLKLEDAYHRLHPEHTLRTCPDGKRRYEYGDRPVSLQALTFDDGEDRESQLAAEDEPERPTPTIETMLREQLEERYSSAMRVAGMLAEGVTSDREIASVLGMTTSQVRDARQDLEPIAQRLRTLSQR